MTKRATLSSNVSLNPDRKLRRFRWCHGERPPSPSDRLWSFHPSLWILWVHRNILRFRPLHSKPPVPTRFLQTQTIWCQASIPGEGLQLDAFSPRDSPAPSLEAAIRERGYIPSLPTASSSVLALGSAFIAATLTTSTLMTSITSPTPWKLFTSLYHRSTHHLCSSRSA
jgi:hypothetical protein